MKVIGKSTYYILLVVTIYCSIFVFFSILHLHSVPLQMVYILLTLFLSVDLWNTCFISYSWTSRGIPSTLQTSSAFFFFLDLRFTKKKKKRKKITIRFQSVEDEMACCSFYWGAFCMYVLFLHAGTVTLTLSVILQFCTPVVSHSPSNCLLLLSSLVNSCPIVSLSTTQFGLASLIVWSLSVFDWLFLTGTDS